MANLRKGGQGGKLNAPMGTLKPAITIERAAELSGSSKRNIQRAKPIVQTGIPELQDMVDSAELFNTNRTYVNQDVLPWRGCRVWVVWIACWTRRPTSDL